MTRDEAAQQLWTALSQTEKDALLVENDDVPAALVQKLVTANLVRFASKWNEKGEPILRGVYRKELRAILTENRKT